MKLEVGDTLMLELKPDAMVSVRCGDVTLSEGRMGRVGDRVAVRVAKPLRKPHTTFAMFEKADETSTTDGGAVINVLPLTIESLVAILLLLTILYCIRLNEQLKRLKADGTSMQQTIAELITATEIRRARHRRPQGHGARGRRDAGRAPARPSAQASDLICKSPPARTFSGACRRSSTRPGLMRKR